MNVRTIALLSALTLGLSSITRAQLAWEATELDLKAAPGDQTAVGHFKYENKGNKMIRVLSVRPSCGCTAAAMKKNEVAPGEKGELTATFNIGGRTGLQQKTINVETDDGGSQFTVLTMKTMVAQLAEVQPSFVYWESGEAPKAKTITVKPGKDITIKNVEVTASTPAFVTEVKPGAVAGEFQINVTPRDTKKQAMATLTIKPNFANLPAKAFYATARVTGAAAAVR